MEYTYNNYKFKFDSIHELFNKSKILILNNNNELIDVVFIPIEYTKDKEKYINECKRLYTVLFT